MKQEATTVERVQFLAPNQAIIYLTNGKKIFNSYGVNIVEYDRINNITKIDSGYWDYSATTSKYRCQFLNEKKPETLKKIKENKYILTELN